MPYRGAGAGRRRPVRGRAARVGAAGAHTRAGSLRRRGHRRRAGAPVALGRPRPRPAARAQDRPHRARRPRRRHGVRDAVRMARRLDSGLLGALLWWAGDVAVLWACFQAFGEPPALAVVVMAYFIGMLANLLPLPGGIGGVDGGMVGALVAFGADPGPAVVAGLAYRGFACWLPIIPGAAAWITLRRTVAGWQRAAEPLGYPPTLRRALGADSAHAIPLAA